MFQVLKSWWKLRRDRRAQQKRLDAQEREFMATHQSRIDRYSYSPLNGRRLLWNISTDGKPPFDPRTGLPTELTFHVNVEEETSYGRSAQYYYNYDVATRRLQYRNSYGYGWSPVPDDA
jgi:hypothetical protein